MKKEIALQAVEDALKNTGVTEEGGDNRGKWIKIYLQEVGLPEGYAWCAAWLKFRYVTAARKLKEQLSDEFLDLNGWTPDWQKYALKHKIWIPIEEVRKNPSLVKPGYAIFYYSKSKERVYHCGLVVRTNKFGVATVEGNTSPGTEIEANGDGVYLKRRNYNRIPNGSGFIRMY